MRPKRYLRVKVSLSECEKAQLAAEARELGKDLAELIRDKATAKPFCALAAKAA